MIVQLFLFLFLLILVISKLFSFLKDREQFGSIDFTRVTLHHRNNDKSELEHYLKAIHLPEKFKKSYLESNHSHHHTLNHKIPEKVKLLYPYEGYMACNYPFDAPSFLKKPFYY